jgi:hypothetical protein
MTEGDQNVSLNEYEVPAAVIANRVIIAGFPSSNQVAWYAPT